MPQSQSSPDTAPIDPANRVGRAEQVAVYRILDANLNRCLEGLRVVEEYLRFALEDPHLASLCKQLRHDVVQATRDLPTARLHAARDAQHDVGAAIQTLTEYERSDARSVATASWKRVEQALRSLEEYTKVVAVQTAGRLEPLRFRAYTLELATTMLQIGAQTLSRARLYVLVDGRSTSEEFVHMVQQLLENGADVIQLRDKSLADRELLQRAKLLRQLTRKSDRLFVMNDRPDLAVLSNADGVHVGQNELSVKDARSIVGPDALIGVSTHQLSQAKQAVIDGANYIGCGPTFPSKTKSFQRFAGIDFLREVSRHIRLPAFAIGGIDAANLPMVLQAGMQRVALQHSVTDAPKPLIVLHQIRTMLDKVGQVCDLSATK